MGTADYEAWSRDELLTEVRALRARLDGAGEEPRDAGEDATEGAYGVMVRQAMLGLLLAQGDPFKVLFANQAMVDIIGLPVEKLQTLSSEALVALVHPADRERVFERFSRRLANDWEDAHTEFRILRADGATKWVHADSRPSEFRGKAALLITFLDVTERVKAEVKLRALNETLEARVAERTATLEEQTRITRAILDSMAEGVIVVEPGPRVILVNRAAQAMFDVPPEVMTDPERVSRDVFRTDTARTYAVEDTPMVRATRGEVVDDEEIFIKPGGREPGFWIAVTARPILSEDGRVSGAVAVIRDITVQKELETELRQSQKLEAVGRLAGGVAHDFNNLLTAITGHAERLFHSMEDGKQRKKVAGILSAGERGEKLVQQLLAFSRKQTGTPELLAFDRVVDETRNVLKWLVGEDVKLSIRLGAEGGCVLADRAQLDQVLANLALNGRDAMPHGGELCIRTECVTVGEVEASRHAVVQPGDYVRFEVSDSGGGIDAAILDRIFEPFFTTKEVGKGTGLGLSTVYGIVKEAGGHIDVESDPDHGTTFQVHLPRARER